MDPKPPFAKEPPVYVAGTLDLEKLKDAIFDWVSSVVGSTVPQDRIIWRNQSQALPVRPCVTMKIIDGPTPIARSGSLFLNAENCQVGYGEQMEMMVSVQIFGTTKEPHRSALQLGVDLNSSLIRQTVLDNLKKGGLAVQQRNGLKNLTGLEETEYEERSGFEILFGLVQNIHDDYGTIKTVNVETIVEVREGDTITQTQKIVLP